MVELGSYPAIERAGWSISTYGRARLCPTRRGDPERTLWYPRSLDIPWVTAGRPSACSSALRDSR